MNEDIINNSVQLRGRRTGRQRDGLWGDAGGPPQSRGPRRRVTQPPAPCFATIQETAFSRGARATAGAPAAWQRGRLPAKAALCRRKGLAGRPCGHPTSGTRRPPPAHQALLPLGDVPGHVIPGSDLDWDPSGDGPAPPVPRPPPRAPEPVTFHRDRAAAARC